MCSEKQMFENMFCLQENKISMWADFDVALHKFL